MFTIPIYNAVALPDTASFLLAQWLLFQVGYSIDTKHLANIFSIFIGIDTPPNKAKQLLAVFADSLNNIEFWFRQFVSNNAIDWVVLNNYPLRRTIEKIT
ncbi:MAG: hypothetical protein R2822_25670 [Spirosomataceae bacterium]